MTSIPDIRAALERAQSDSAAADAEALIAHKADSDAGAAALIAGKPVAPPRAHAADTKATHAKGIVASLEAQLADAEKAERQGRAAKHLAAHQALSAELKERGSLALALIQTAVANYIELTGRAPQFTWDQLLSAPGCTPNLSRTDYPPLIAEMHTHAGHLANLKWGVDSLAAVTVPLPTEKDRARAAALISEAFSKED